MSVIEWNESLSVGDLSMDLHHRHLIGMLQRLHRSIHAPDGTEAVGGVLADLVAYADFHFEEEEARMRAVAYPDLETHRLTHQRLAAQVIEMKRNYDANPHSILAEELFQFLSDWLIHHIQDEDMRYRPWMTAAGQDA